MKDYDAIEISKQKLISEDLDLIETNRDLIAEVKRLKKFFIPSWHVQRFYLCF